jgi:hypothetical protein
MMKRTVVCVVVLAVASCGKDKAKTGDKVDPAKPTTEEPVAADPPPPKAPPKLPPMVELAFDEWGIKLMAPSGTAVTEVSPGDEEMKMPDNATLSTEVQCGMDIDISRHWKTDLDSFYDSGKKDTLDALKYMTDEKTATGFKIHYTGNAPIGAMYGVDTGLVVGDRLILCSGGLNRMTEEEAACVFAVCTSITAK